MTYLFSPGLGNMVSMGALYQLLPGGLTGSIAIVSASLRYGGAALASRGLLIFLSGQIRIIRKRNRKTSDIALRYTFAA